MDLDLRTNLSWWEELPFPDWERVFSFIAELEDERSQREQTALAARGWLDLLSESLNDYSIDESPHFLSLVPASLQGRRSILEYAENCRQALLGVLGDIPSFDDFEKQVLIVFDSQTEYYRHTTYFHEEGSYGGSAGMHIRTGYPHVVTYGRDRRHIDPVLAHELTHVGLRSREMPTWIEEGLAQTFEIDMSDRRQVLLDAEKADKQRRHWKKHGLDSFWIGNGFSAPGKRQELCYQLAEIFARLMLSDARPRWFGLVKEPRRQYLEFLRTARFEDCGAAAYEQQFGRPLSDLAARFLGDGDWTPPKRNVDAAR